jgi:hypothetical protein
MSGILRARAACAASLVALATACGGTAFDGRVYRGDGMAFRVGQVPAGWRAINADGALIAYRDDPDGATVAVNGRCGKDGDDVPLSALTHHLFIYFTDRQVIDETKLELDGRAALRTRLTASLDGVPKRFTVYVLKKDGCVYDFMYIAAVDAPPSGEQDFERFVTGFSTLGDS